MRALAVPVEPLPPPRAPPPPPQPPPPPLPAAAARGAADVPSLPHVGGGSALGLILAQLETISGQLASLDSRVAKAERALAALTAVPPTQSLQPCEGGGNAAA